MFTILQHGIHADSRSNQGAKKWFAITRKKILKPNRRCSRWIIVDLFRRRKVVPNLPQSGQNGWFRETFRDLLGSTKKRALLQLSPAVSKGPPAFPAEGYFSRSLLPFVLPPIHTPCANSRTAAQKVLFPKVTQSIVL
jgi:hypothetical protein